LDTSVNYQTIDTVRNYVRCVVRNPVGWWLLLGR
jgi:hypothetical protein